MVGTPSATSSASVAPPARETATSAARIHNPMFGVCAITVQSMSE